MERKIVELLVSGKGFNAVCRDLGVGRNRVAHIREKAREYGYLDRRIPILPYPEALFPEPVDGRSLKTSEADLQLQTQRQWIEDRLQAGWQPITIFEELPVSIGRSSFYRFLHRHKLIEIGENARMSLIEEIIYAPAEALIVDWGKLRDVIDPETGKKRNLWMFIGVLGYSRYMMVHLVWSYDVPTTLATLEEMFKELGGVPKRIISDNPKCFALEASKYEPLINPVYERFAAHYGTTIECLPPGSPELNREAERVAKAIDRFLCITSYRRELTGIYGKSEDEATYLVIGEKYPVENPELYKADLNEFIMSLPPVIIDIQEVIRKADFLFKKHIPTINKRETEEQVKARQEKENKIDEEWEQKRNTERDDFISQWGKPEKVAIPDGMIAVKLEITFDDSHPQSDYFAPHRQVGSDLCLGFVHRGPKTERLARSILAKYPELNKHKFTWHVENYSMGHGNYLISEYTGIRIKQGAYDGRQEVETRFEIRFDTYSKEMYPYKNYSSAEVIQGSNETAHVSDGINVSMRLNDEKEGVELKFTGKPSEEIIASLRIAGFRWSRPKRLWYAKQSESTIAFAKKLCSSEDIPSAELQETLSEASPNEINVEETIQIPEEIGSFDEELVTSAVNTSDVQTSVSTEIYSQMPTPSDQLTMF